MEKKKYHITNSAEDNAYAIVELDEVEFSAVKMVIDELNEYSTGYAPKLDITEI